MNDFKSAGLPKELIYAVSKLSGAKRQRVQITPSTSQQINSGSGSLCVFQLPADAVVDLSTLSLIGKWRLYCATTATDAQVISYINPPSHQLFSMATLSVNGGIVVSGSQNSYQHITQEAWYRAQADQSYLNSHCLENLNNTFTPASGNANFGGQIAINATSSDDNHYIVYNNFPCARASRFLDTSVYGFSTISLKPSSINCIKGTYLSERNARWELTDCVLEVEIMSSLPEEYISLVKELVAQGKQFKMNICNEVSSIYAGNNNTVLLNVSTQSLDGVLVAPLIDESGFYGTVTSNLVCPPFNFRWAPTNVNPSLHDQVQFSFKVGSYMIPETPYPRLLNLANATAESLYGDSMYAKHNLFVSDCSNANALTYNREGYCDLNGVVYQNLSALREAGWSNYDQTISGVPTFGQSVVVQVSYNKTNPPPKVMVCAETTSTIVFDSQSGAVSLIQ